MTVPASTEALRGPSASLPPVYLISDADRVGENRFVEVVASASRGGLRMVQLREPGWPLDRLRDLGARLQTCLGPSGLVIVSLHPGEDGAAREELIRDLECAGGHLGRCAADTTARARESLGPGSLLGYSAHTPEEARQAFRGGADYVSYSPIFAPRSKASAGAAVGLEGLSRVCSLSSGPVYALGGVTPARASDVKAAGAAGIAVIGALLEARDPEDACRALLAPWKQ